MILTQLERAITRVSQGIALVGLACLLFLTFAVVLDVILRWLFNSPIVGVHDASGLLVAIVISASFPVVMAERRNITIRFIGDLLGPRWRDIFDAFGHLIVLIVFGLLTWQIWVYTNELSESNEVTWILGWRFEPWWRFVTIIMIIGVLTQAIVVLVAIKSALTAQKSASRKIPGK